MGLGDELVTQRMSFAGSSPTYEAMPLTHTYWLDPIACTPTVLPFRSGMLWMPFRANSSKQPTCTPDTIVMGLPALIAMMSGGEKLVVKSISPRPRPPAAI